jgi:hypothetical protein
LQNLVTHINSKLEISSKYPLIIIFYKLHICRKIKLQIHQKYVIHRNPEGSTVNCHESGLFSLLVRKAHKGTMAGVVLWPTRGPLAESAFRPSPGWPCCTRHRRPFGLFRGGTTAQKAFWPTFQVAWPDRLIWPCPWRSQRASGTETAQSSSTSPRGNSTGQTTIRSVSSGTVGTASG